MSNLQTTKAANMASWEKNDPRYKVCPKCGGDGVQVTKARRVFSQCSVCSGSGWKFQPVKA